MILAVASLSLGLVGCAGQTKPPLSKITGDPPGVQVEIPGSSMAATLARAERDFEQARLNNDPVGMAQAGLSRTVILDSPDISEAIYGSVLETTRAMLASARTAANGDENILKQIARLAPGTVRAQTNRDNAFGRLFGLARRVDYTIGVEMEIMLASGASETATVPVSLAEGTVFHAQPAGRYIPNVFSITLKVRAFTGEPLAGDLLCNQTQPHGRLVCFIPPGGADALEVELINEGTFDVSVMLFVSGNANSELVMSLSE